LKSIEFFNSLLGINEVPIAPGGYALGLTIHFEKPAPDALEQWLSTEARYIIGTFGKPADLQLVFGAKTDAVIAECKQLGENIVSGITMILDADMRKLHMASVHMRNGETFMIDSKYKLVGDAGAKALANALLKEDGPRIFSVTSK
jgi:hypothetical protein